MAEKITEEGFLLRELWAEFVYTNRLIGSLKEPPFLGWQTHALLEKLAEAQESRLRELSVLSGICEKGKPPSLAPFITLA